MPSRPRPLGTRRVLVLNLDYSPLEVITWEEAVEKTLQGKYLVLETYEDAAVRSAYLTLEMPAVVCLAKRFAQPKVKLSRKRVLERDNFTCQYCGLQPSNHGDLTMDHVIPRAHATGGLVTLPWQKEKVRVTSWENLITACTRCNHSKADRTPKQAGYTLAKKPRKPHPPSLVRARLSRRATPKEWDKYLEE